MKRQVVILLGVLSLVPASAQPVGATVDSSIAVQQQRLDALRQQIIQQGREEERACQEKFAVNDCVKAARARDREKLTSIRRQQESLHDLQRKQRGEEQSRRQEEKKLEHTQKLRDAGANPGPEASAVPAPKQRDAQRLPLPVVESGKSLESSRQSKQAAVEQGATGNRQAYERKLQDAELKRQERDKRLKEKAAGKPTVPLPSAP
ncbi:MAG: hypothetical protein KGN32_02985 [Burkholderiales bacterium]|nr:hypothetical protein [Burkholderiales bacterium]